MEKISVICVYNNKDMLERCLLKNLPDDENIELLLINNTDNKFTSAAAALNYGAKSAKHDNLMFVHQDIDFKDEKNFKSLCQMALPLMKTNSIIGVAGKTTGIALLVTNITYGAECKPYDSFRITKPYAVDTVDECLFMMKKEVWKEHCFDEKLCDSWHLYAAEMCLFSRSKGNNAYVVPVDVNHYSVTGSLDSSFFRTLKKLVYKYKSNFFIINTSCIIIKTRHYMLNYLLYKIRKALFK